MNSKQRAYLKSLASTMNPISGGKGKPDSGDRDCDRRSTGKKRIGKGIGTEKLY